MIEAEYMSSPDVNGENLNRLTRGTSVAIIITIAVSILTTGFLLYLQRPTPPQYSYELTITQIRFSALTPGQVIFDLDNSGSMHDVTISQVFVQGAGINGTASAYPNSTIPARATTFLTVDFPRVGFQLGARYDFTLITSSGNKFPASAIRQ